MSDYQNRTPPVASSQQGRTDAPERVAADHAMRMLGYLATSARVYGGSDVSHIQTTRENVIATYITETEAENARLREALEDIVTTLAVGEDWCGFCGTLNHHPHTRDCPYPIARRALNRETTDE